MNGSLGLASGGRFGAVEEEPDPSEGRWRALELVSSVGFQRVEVDPGVRVPGLGIEGDILYGPGQVRSLVLEATAAGVRAQYRELRSTKGHDAFLVEWDQLAGVPAEAAPRTARSASEPVA